MNPPEIGKTVTDDLAKLVPTSDFSALRRNCRIAKASLQDQPAPQRFGCGPAQCPAGGVRRGNN